MLFDTIVIGAGPAGATAARLLAAADWAVALVEKSPFPRRKVCGEFVSAPTFSVLDACGVGADFRALAGPPVRTIALFAGETIVTAPSPRAGDISGWGRALGREHLDVLLRDAAVAAGATLFQPAELVTVERDTDGHACHLKIGEGETVLHARAVIAASGSWRVKPPFAVVSEETPSDLLAFKANFASSALAEGAMPLLAFPGGYGGMVHTDSGRTSLSCCIRREALAALREPGARAGEAVLRHIRASTRGAREALAASVPEGTILSTGPIRPGLRPRYEDGIFFCGNLAGEAHPVIAEGISMAIQSAWLLSQRLRAGGPSGDLDAMGATYARDWRRRFGARILSASAFAHAAMYARIIGTAVARRVPTLLTWGAELSGKMQPL